MRGGRSHGGQPPPSKQPVGSISVYTGSDQAATAHQLGGVGLGVGLGKEKGGHGGRRGVECKKRKGLYEGAEGDMSVVMSQ